MFKWFRDCKTAEDGKTLYHELAKQFHPDNGGTGEELKEIISEFKIWWARFKDIHTAKDGHTYKAEKETRETAEEFIDIINKLSAVPDIQVEMCGTWLWITGNTYPYKDYLKQCGCRWSSGKKRWYWTSEPYTKYSSHKSMNAIRFMFGSEMVHLDRKPELQ